jgi:polyisoprenoid-binding protein YceI
MRVRILFLFALAVGVCAAPAATLEGEGEKPESLKVTKAPPRALNYRFVLEKSSIHFEIATTFSLIRGRALHWNGSVRVDTDSPGAIHSRIVIGADSLESSNRVRDHDLRDVVLEAVKYPEIVFSATSYKGDLSKLAPGTLVTIEIAGDLTVHGVTQPIQTSIQCAMLEDHLFVTGAVPIHWKAFGVHDMSKMFSKVKDPMTIIFRLWAVPEE